MTHQQDKYFLHESLKRLINKYPEHEFIIMTDHADDKFLFSRKKCNRCYYPSTFARHPLLRKLWFDFKLPAILKKYKADVFVSCRWILFAGNTSYLNVFYCMTLLSYTIPMPLKNQHLFFYKRYFPKFLHKATSIATGSAYLKKDLSLRYKIAEDKIDVVAPCSQRSFSSR